MHYILYWLKKYYSQVKWLIMSTDKYKTSKQTDILNIQSHGYWTYTFALEKFFVLFSVNRTRERKKERNNKM